MQADPTMGLLPPHEMRFPGGGSSGVTAASAAGGAGAGGGGQQQPQFVLCRAQWSCPHCEVLNVFVCPHPPFPTNYTSPCSMCQHLMSITVPGSSSAASAAGPTAPQAASHAGTAAAPDSRKRARETHGTDSPSAKRARSDSGAPGQPPHDSSEKPAADATGAAAAGTAAIESATTSHTSSSEPPTSSGAGVSESAKAASAGAATAKNGVRFSPAQEAEFVDFYSMHNGVPGREHILPFAHKLQLDPSLVQAKLSAMVAARVTLQEPIQSILAARERSLDIPEAKLRALAAPERITPPSPDTATASDVAVNEQVYLELVQEYKYLLADEELNFLVREYTDAVVVTPEGFAKLAEVSGVSGDDLVALFLQRLLKFRLADIQRSGKVPRVSDLPVLVRNLHRAQLVGEYVFLSQADEGERFMDDDILALANATDPVRVAEYERRSGEWRERELTRRRKLVDAALAEAQLSEAQRVVMRFVLNTRREHPELKVAYPRCRFEHKSGQHVDALCEFCQRPVTDGFWEDNVAAVRDPTLHPFCDKCFDFGLIAEFADDEMALRRQAKALLDPPSKQQPARDGGSGESAGGKLESVDELAKRVEDASSGFGSVLGAVDDGLPSFAADLDVPDLGLGATASGSAAAS